MRCALRSVVPLVVFVGGVVGGAACGGDALGVAWPIPEVRPGVGDLTVRLWVCRVPLGTTAPEYQGLPLRHDVDPDEAVAAFGTGVAAYFAAVSHGSLRLAVVSGGEVRMSIDDGPQQCIAAARQSTAPDEVVLAVADAEHTTGAAGGFGIVGDAESAGAAYVGGNDLAALPGPPPLDLVEHELGHAIGWVHSGYDAAAVVALRYRSALDVMSDSVAPRAVDPSRRDGPDTLAIDRLLVGWLPLAEVAVVGRSRTEVALAPSTGDAIDGAHRVAVVPIDDGRFATVELLVPTGYDSHLPTAGVAVHVVSVVDGSVTEVAPLHAPAPYSDLLQTGEVLEVSGRTVRVGATLDGVVTVTVDAG